MQIPPKKIQSWVSARFEFRERRDGAKSMLSTIDHINNDGNIHRASFKSLHIYYWLKQNGYPTGYQVLCFTCNIGKHLNGGVCPHQIDE